VDDEARRRRAEARRENIVLRKTRLDAEGDDVVPCRGTAAVSLVWRLTRESWSLAGRAIPTYRRDETPYRFVPRRST
jgi:hypothetical protein